MGELGGQWAMSDERVMGGRWVSGMGEWVHVKEYKSDTRSRVSECLMMASWSSFGIALMNISAISM